MLANRLLAWLGRISYSLYLVHVPGAACGGYLLHTVLPLWLIALVAPVLSIGAADLVYRLVEGPSVAWGHRLSRALTVRLTPAKLAPEPVTEPVEPRPK